MSDDAFSIGFAVAGVGMVVYCSWSLVKGLVLRWSGVRTTGVVVDYRARALNTNSDKFYPIVEFTDAAGAAHCAVAEASAAPRLCRVGRDVRVVYARGDPERFRLDQFGGRGTWFEIGFIVYGLVMVVFALMLPRGG